MLVEHGFHMRSQIGGVVETDLCDVEGLAGLDEGYLDQRVVSIRGSFELLARTARDALSGSPRALEQGRRHIYSFTSTR